MKIRVTEIRSRVIEVAVDNTLEGDALREFLKDKELEAIEDENFFLAKGTEGKCFAEVIE